MKTVFFDIDTQNDFMLPSGALYVPGAEHIVPTIARLNHLASARGIQVVSTVDAHAEDDPEFGSWPPHCVAGTLGQQKPQSTLAGQIIFSKQVLSCFDAPGFAPLLKELGADRYAVYGVVTEICVRFAAFGLLETGKPVSIVTDAIRSLNSPEAQKMLDEFAGRGGVLTDSQSILSLHAGA
ncbi:MAG: cysteine hydrolase [Bryobacterales bacterium]|nr:cysteine hydrolase [Bryobacterales bacterium]